MVVVEREISFEPIRAQLRAIEALPASVVSASRRRALVRSLQRALDGLCEIAGAAS